MPFGLTLPVGCHQVSFCCCFERFCSLPFRSGMNCPKEAFRVGAPQELLPIRFLIKRKPVQDLLVVRIALRSRRSAGLYRNFVSFAVMKKERPARGIAPRDRRLRSGNAALPKPPDQAVQKRLPDFPSGAFGENPGLPDQGFSVVHHRREKADGLSSPPCGNEAVLRKIIREHPVGIRRMHVQRSPAGERERPQQPVLVSSDIPDFNFFHNFYLPEAKFAKAILPGLSLRIFPETCYA